MGIRISTSRVRACGLAIGLLLGTGTLSAHATDHTPPVYTVAKVKLGADKAELRRLLAAGFDIAGVDYETGTVDVIVRDTASLAGRRFQGFDVVSYQEIDTRLAPDQNYKTPDEVTQFVQKMAADHPHLVKVESIGKTIEGRDMWAVKISDNVEQHERDEPAILFNAMHHAREVMTTEVAIDTIEYLVNNYGTDARVTKWVDNNEIWVVPQVNPDGNNKVWTSNSMWRKNVKGGYGVDINRNYSFAWNTCNGSSGSTWADDYRGPSAGSEPETQNMMAFITRIQPVFNISYHSYSELVIYPYGCDGERTPNKEVVETLGNEMASKLQRDSGSGTYRPGTAWEMLYSVDGSDIDWMYAEQNVIPFVIEMNSSTQGFQPAYRYRQPTVEKLRNAWMLLLDKLEASSIRGVVTDGTGRTPANATVVVQNQAPGMTQALTWMVKNDSTYHIVVKPGSYRLTFKSGERTVARDVIVGQDRVNVDVEL